MKNFKTLSNDLRKKIITISYSAKSSHIGSPLSIVDILVVLYQNILKKYFYS